jgi:hypothetical protein
VGPGWNHFGIATSPVPDGHAGDYSLGVTTASLSCLPGLPGVGIFNGFHTLRGVGIDGGITYETVRPQWHLDHYGESNLSVEVRVPSRQATLHWYWSVENRLGGPAFPLPGMVVEATLRTGNEISVDDEAFDAGALVAHGRSGPALLAGPESNGVVHSRVGAYDVYEFAIPLAFANDTFPSGAYNLRIDTYVVRDGCPADGYLTPNGLTIHTSPEHRPRIELAAEDAPVIPLLHAAALNASLPDRVVIHAAATTPWGNGDLASMELTIRFLDGAFVASTVLVQPHPRFHCHCPPEPVQSTWLWDAGLDGAAPGTYWATAVATSLQGKQTQATLEFTLAAQQEAPAPAPILLALALAAALLVSRRR